MRAWFRAARPTPAWTARYEGAYDQRLGRRRLSYTAAERYLRQSIRRRRAVRLTAALCATAILLAMLYLAVTRWRTQQDAKWAEFQRRTVAERNETLSQLNAKLIEANDATRRINQKLTKSNRMLDNANQRNVKINLALQTINTALNRINAERTYALNRVRQVNETLTTVNQELAKAKDETDRANRELKAAKENVEAALAGEIEAERKQEQAERFPRARADVARALAVAWGTKDDAPALSKSIAQIAESILRLYGDTGKLYRFQVDALLELLGRSSLQSTVHEGTLAAGVRDGALVAAESTTSRPGAHKSPPAQRAIISADGSMMVYGFPKGYVSVVWPDGARSAKIHTFAITGLGMSRDGKWLASSNTSGGWSVQPVNRLKNPSRAGNALRRFADELNLAWRMIVRRIPGDYPIQQVAVANAFDGGKPALAAVSESGVLEYVQRSADWRRPPQPDFRFGAVTVDPSGAIFWAGTWTGDIGPIDEGGLTPVYRPVAAPITALAWDETGSRLAAGLQDGRIIVMVKVGAPRSPTIHHVQLPGTASPVAGLSWAAGTRPLLASTGADGSARLWDVSGLAAAPELMDRLFRLSGAAAVPRKAPYSAWVLDPQSSEEVATADVDLPGLLKLLEANLNLRGSLQ
jgi:hypothetical protein